MTRAVSLNTMVKQIYTLSGTKDISAWEEDFVRSINEKTSNGEHTQMLTERQTNIIQRIWEKHFA